MGTRLSVLDASWLLIDRRKTPMHIAGLSLFRLPEDVDPSFLRELFSRHRNCDAVRSPFKDKLGMPRLGLPVLDEDPEFDIDYHVRHSALPAGGSYRDLFVLVSRLHGVGLDLSRPLWEFHLIEGLPDRQYALYTKVHHSLADGMAGLRMIGGSLSEDPNDRNMDAPWSVGADEIGRIDVGADEPRPRMRPSAMLSKYAGVVPELARVAGELFRVGSGLRESPLRTPWQAPPCVLNGNLSGARRIVCQSWPQARIRRVADLLDATVNEVLLAMCAGALRAYLLSQNALPDRPLICAVPVAVPREKKGLGNSLGVAFANLGTDSADPEKRLRAIRESVNAGRQLLGSLSSSALVGYTLMTSTPLALEQLLRIAGSPRPAFNLVISNVQGPRRSLYWNGARMERVYPISLLPNGQALNISAMSYAGSFDFGIVACRRTLPSMQRLIDHLEDSLVDLEQLAGDPAGEAVAS